MALDQQAFDAAAILFGMAVVAQARQDVLDFQTAQVHQQDTNVEDTTEGEVDEPLRPFGARTGGQDNTLAPAATSTTRDIHEADGDTTDEDVSLPLQQRTAATQTVKLPSQEQTSRASLRTGEEGQVMANMAPDSSEDDLDSDHDDSSEKDSEYGPEEKKKVTRGKKRGGARPGAGRPRKSNPGAVPSANAGKAPRARGGRGRITKPSQSATRGSTGKSRGRGRSKATAGRRRR